MLKILASIVKKNLYNCEVNLNICLLFNLSFKAFYAFF